MAAFMVLLFVFVGCGGTLWWVLTLVLRIEQLEATIGFHSQDAMDMREEMSVMRDQLDHLMGVKK